MNRMDWTKRSLIGASMLFGLAPSLARADDDAYPLWEVRRGGAKIFLFGDGASMTDPWRSARIERAFAESTVFWKETPDPGPGDSAKYLARGLDRQRKLSSWLDQSQRDRLTAAEAAAGITGAFLDGFDPWLAAGILSSAYWTRQKPLADPMTVLTAAATSTGKPIRTEFPDVDSLIASMAGLPPAAQVEYLMSTIDDIQAGLDARARRVTAWGSGNVSLEAQRVLWQIKTYPDLYQALDGARNRGWMPRFMEMLESGGPTFVLVGADHLVGPESILVGLTEAGMPARRI